MIAVDPGMEIRAFRAEDTPFALEAFRGNLPEFFAAHELQEYQDFLGRLEAGELGALRYLTVVQGGAPRAFGGWFKRQEPGAGGLCWGLVARSHHRQGLGSALLAVRLGEMALECERCVLDTTPRSFGFYRRFGFVQTQHIADGYAPGLDKVLAELVFKEA